MSEPLTYTQYLYSISNPAARQYMIDLSTALNNGQISPAQFVNQVEAVTGKVVKPVYSKSGDVLAYTLNETATVTASNSINSNAATVSRGAVSRPVATTVQTGQNVVTASGVTGIGTRIATGCALVGCAAAAVATGITLGKTVDSLLYNANPDFWDSQGMSSLNPATWSAITAGQSGLGADLINLLFDFDPDTGEAQAYMDEDSFAYMASYLQSVGFFTIPSTTSVEIPDITQINSPVQLCTSFTITKSDGYTWEYYTDADTIFVLFYNGSRYNHLALSKYPNRHYYYRMANSSTIYTHGLNAATYNGITFYMTNTAASSYANISGGSTNTPYMLASNITNETAYKILFSDYSFGVDGIGTQSGATTPQNLTGNPTQDLPLLQSQYPDLWNDAITYPVVQPDGTVRNDVYIPVALPNINTRTDTQPTSGDSTQANPQIDTSMQELIEELTKILQNPYPQPDTNPDDTSSPENPTDTGDGSSPVPVVPVGSASALWKIYHPTQSQIDSFGGWLWSSNFIDQILKIFNNPMEAVIGLHKVYATPIDAGTATIKVGYLDSQVPSAYIEQQYIDVSCGSVNLYEQFGNVFDYSPFTDVQLYLPFIGIVPLNVADVMRSTIFIKYGVDVITGACLAQVTVSRDNNSSVLYQYSGNCAVQYPISSGSYMGIVSSIISVAGGVAATVASGGAAAPLALGAAGGLLNAHTSVQHSGGFSGNAGAMGGKIPYLIITRPQTKVSPNFETMEGYPTNNYINVGDCTGYIKASTVHVIDVNATEEELKEINDLLLSGIII